MRSVIFVQLLLITSVSGFVPLNFGGENGVKAPASLVHRHLVGSRYTKLDSCLHYSSYSDDDGQADGEEARSSSSSSSSASSFDVEAARHQLESLMLKTEENDSSSSEANGNTDSTTNFSVMSLISPLRDISLPTPPPITSIERERRLAEIELLQKLKQSDEAEEELLELWSTQRGAEGKRILEKADDLMQTVSTWDNCEKLLLNTIKDHGVYFVEPVYKLAKLYYLQGIYDRAYKLFKVVLMIKPWHFECKSDILRVCVKQKDKSKARMWAGRRLPTFRSKEGPLAQRRNEWVDLAVIDAKESIGESELRTKQSFGHPEDYYYKLNVDVDWVNRAVAKAQEAAAKLEMDEAVSQSIDMDEDSWQ